MPRGQVSGLRSSETRCGSSTPHIANPPAKNDPVEAVQQYRLAGLFFDARKSPIFQAPGATPCLKSSQRSGNGGQTKGRSFRVLQAACCQMLARTGSTTTRATVRALDAEARRKARATAGRPEPFATVHGMRSSARPLAGVQRNSPPSLPSWPSRSRTRIASRRPTSATL